MYIKEIKISNFRNFKEVSVPFHERVDVIIGHNNTGKSNLLRAVWLVLGYSDGRRLGTSDLFYETDVVMGVCLSRMRGIGCNQQRMGIFRQPSFPWNKLRIKALVVILPRPCRQITDHCT